MHLSQFFEHLDTEKTGSLDFQVVADVIGSYIKPGYGGRRHATARPKAYAAPQVPCVNAPMPYSNVQVPGGEADLAGGELADMASEISRCNTAEIERFTPKMLMMSGDGAHDCSRSTALASLQQELQLLEMKLKTTQEAHDAPDLEELRRLEDEKQTTKAALEELQRLEEEKKAKEAEEAKKVEEEQKKLAALEELRRLEEEKKAKEAEEAKKKVQDQDEQKKAAALDELRRLEEEKKAKDAEKAKKHAQDQDEQKKAAALDELRRLEEEKKAKEAEEAKKKVQDQYEQKKAAALEELRRLEDAKKAKEAEEAKKVEEEQKKAAALEELRKLEDAKKAKAAADGKNIREVLMRGITLFAFDFAGCGQSEGDYITLGYHERDDVQEVIKYLRETGEAAFDGRRVPFASLEMVVRELIARMPIRCKLGFMVNAAMGMVRRSVNDELIDPHHTHDIYDIYAGDKNIVLIEGDHNSQRPQYLADGISIFLYERLCLPAGLAGELPAPEASRGFEDGACTECNQFMEAFGYPACIGEQTYNALLLPGQKEVDFSTFVRFFGPHIHPRYEEVVELREQLCQSRAPSPRSPPPERSAPRVSLTRSMSATKGRPPTPGMVEEDVWSAAPTSAGSGAASSSARAAQLGGGVLKRSVPGCHVPEVSRFKDST
eukprot:g24325.t1